MTDIAKIFGVSLLMAQLAVISYARVSPMRYFCWAPFHAKTQYRIAVTVNDKDLSPTQIRARYRIPAEKHDGRFIYHVQNIIQQYETTYGQEDQAQVTLRYRINGRLQEDWQWPQE